MWIGKITDEERKLVELAIGRIFRLGSRPARPGDVEEYERCRRIILDHADEPAPEWRPSMARDFNRENKT